MRKNYFLLLSALLAAGTFTFVSCSEDDDNNTAEAQVQPVDFTKTGGDATITLADGTKIEMPIPQVSSDNPGGVSICDGELGVNIYNSENLDDLGYSYKYENSSISISEYSATKTVYENVSFYFSKGESIYDPTTQTTKSTYINVQSVVVADNVRSAESPSNRVTVTQQSDGSYKFVIEGDVSVQSEEIQGQYNMANAPIAMEILMPLVANSEKMTSVSSKLSSFPSFTPWQNGKTADGVLKITNSQLVKSGVLLWYYDMTLGYSDYENLKAQAVQVLGKPVNCHDASTADGNNSGEWQDIAAAYFYKDGKYIMVSYCPWRQEENLEYAQMPFGWESIMENHAARIQVHALDGIGFDYNNLIRAHW